MSTLLNGLSAILVLGGIVLLFVSAAGALRFPDFYTRSHALGVMDTLGALIVSLGIIVGLGWSLISLKLILLVAFIFIANPTVTHILVRAARKSGLVPWNSNRD